MIRPLYKRKKRQMIVNRVRLKRHFYKEGEEAILEEEQADRKTKNSKTKRASKAKRLVNKAIKNLSKRRQKTSRHRRLSGHP
jgi:hypothetical protein